MDNSYNLDPPKWTTHTILYRGRTSLKLYITIYKHGGAYFKHPA